MNTKDPKYGQTVALGERLFEQRIEALSKEFRRITEQTAARGFSTLTGPAIGEMSNATVQALRSTSDELLALYARTFGEGPADGPETLDAVRNHLADHTCKQMESLAASFEGALESREAGRGASDPGVDQALHQV